jgi:hypothetical protein
MSRFANEFVVYQFHREWGESFRNVLESAQLYLRWCSVFVFPFASDLSPYCKYLKHLAMPALSRVQFWLSFYVLISIGMTC